MSQLRSGERLTIRTWHLFRYKANAVYKMSDTDEGSAGERGSKVRRLEVLELETCSSGSGHGGAPPQDSLSSVWGGADSQNGGDCGEVPANAVLWFLSEKSQIGCSDMHHGQDDCTISTVQ